MADSKPLSEIVVGDRFWLAYAQDAVRGALTAPDKRADQLTAAIAWFWTVYSAAGLLAITFAADRLTTLAGGLIALPSALLIAAYWKAGNVRRPVLFDFDPRVPSEIEHVHAETAKQKRKALKQAELLTGLAAVCVVVALTAAMLQSPSLKPYLDAQVDLNDPAQLFVSGQFPKNAVIQIAVQPSAPADAPVSTLMGRAADDGAMRGTFQVRSAPAYRVTASWSEEKIDKSMALEVKRGH